MAIDVDRVQLLFLFLSVSEAIVSKLYTVNFEFDNKATINTPSETLSSASLSICACSCGDGCKCFSFNSQTKMCRLHRSCDCQTVSDTGWRLYTNPTLRPKDCKELYNSGKLDSGVYTIYPWERFDPNCRPVQVYCDMETEGGGWTAIQRRVNGEESFNRSWAEYKFGFGSPHEDHWIGNDVIHQLTKDRNSSLYITITSSYNGMVSFIMYNQFSIDGEEQKYTLRVADPGYGSLDDGLLSVTNSPSSGMNFSTIDNDNDAIDTHCAELFAGAWWFKFRPTTFLNGPWSLHYWTNPWFPQYKKGEDVNGTSMLIRPHL